MATHDYVLDNATGANFRADLNLALAAIVSNNSSSSEPSTKYAYQWWADTNEGVLKIRNSSNDGWVTLLQLDGTLTLEDGTNSAPALGFRDDLNTGIFSSAADTLDVTCGGTTRGSFSSSGLTVTGNVTATTFVGNIDAVDGDFDGTLEADAITVAGTALSTVIAGTTLTQAAQTNITSLGTLTGLTLSGDMTFTGDSANIVFDKSDNALEFADNAKAAFGTGSDLTLHHDGTNTFITNNTNQFTIRNATADADFFIKADDIRIWNSAGNEQYITADRNSAVELYFDNSPKFATTSGGATVTGNLSATTNFKGDDNVALALGTGTDFRILHDGSDNVITSDGGQAIRIVNHLSGGNENMIRCVPNAAVELYHNNHKSFQTSTHGAQFFAPEGGTCQVFLYADEGDDNADLWGFQASHSASEFKLINYASGSYEDSIVADGNGAVELYYDNSKKLETTSSGVTVTGTVSDTKGNVRQVPLNTKTSSYTAVASDAGKVIYISTGGVTINNGVFSQGDMLTIINNSGSDQTITRGSGLSLYFTADGTIASRTLAGRGMATIYFNASSGGYISGTGLS